MSVVPAKISDPLVQSSQQETSFLPTPRPLDAPRNPSLNHAQLSACRPVGARSWNQLTRRSRSKVLDAEVHSHGAHHRSSWDGRNLDRQDEAGVPATRNTADGLRAHLRRGGQLPMPLHLKMADS